MIESCLSRSLEQQALKLSLKVLEQALETLLAKLPLSAKVVSLWQDIRLSVHLQTLHLCKYMILKTGSHLCALVLAPAPAAGLSCF